MSIESTWVLTSYLVSNAIVLPATGWLSSMFGRKRYYMASVVIFVASSFLCGLAPSLTMLIVFRVLQGLGGGALQPISQAVLLECYPRRLRGIGMAIFGIGVVFAPIIGPTLGGWLTDNYTWRWIFYINVPIGILALAMSQIYVVDPPYLRRGSVKMDYIGLGLLALGIGTLQVVLDTGQRHDWFQTTWIVQLAVVSGVSLVVLLIWEWFTRHPVIDLRIFNIRNYPAGIALVFAVGIALYSSGVLQPLFLQELLGYTALWSGLALSPGGVGTLICMPIVGKLVGKWNPRYMIMFGFGLSAVALFKMSALHTRHQLLAGGVPTGIPWRGACLPVRAVDNRDIRLRARREDRQRNRHLQPDAKHWRQFRDRRGNDGAGDARAVPSIQAGRQRDPAQPRLSSLERHHRLAPDGGGTAPDGSPAHRSWHRL